AATRRRTIRGCWWASARRRNDPPSACGGRTDASKSGPRWPSIDGPRSNRAAAVLRPGRSKDASVSRGPAAAIVVACVVAAAAGACTRRDDRSIESGSAARPPRSALRPVSLPDLSQLASSAQAQVRERHAALTERLAAPGTSDADLAVAYGE